MLIMTFGRTYGENPAHLEPQNLHCTSACACRFNCI